MSETTDHDPHSARTALITEALEAFRRSDGCRNPMIVAVLDDFGNVLEDFCEVLLDIEETRRKAVSSDIFARAETAYEIVHGQEPSLSGPGSPYFRRLKAMETLRVVGKEMKDFMTSAAPKWFPRRRPEPNMFSSASETAQAIADAWFPKGHHDNVLLAEDVRSALERFDPTGKASA